MPKKKIFKTHHHRHKISWSKTLIKLTLFALSGLLAVWFIQTEYSRFLLDQILPYKLVGAFFTGILYTSFITIPLAIVGLLLLAQVTDPLSLAVLGGLGAMIGDYIIVRVFRNLYQNDSLGLTHLIFSKIREFLHAFNLNFLVMVLGAFVIISPFPDEIGLILLGISDISYRKLLLLTFVLNTIGIMVLTAPVYLVRM